jgi:hypothetical protein
MAHYSELNSQNIVTAVRTAADEENFDGEKYFHEKYGTVHKRTSRNTRDGFHYDPVTYEISLDQSKAFRKNFGSVGSLYDEELDAFIPPKPADYMVFNEEKCNWDYPTPKPDGPYAFNESLLVWEEITPPFPSWVWNSTEENFISPVPFPQDISEDSTIVWNESTQSWDID